MTAGNRFTTLAKLRNAALVRWIAGCACLLVLSSGCDSLRLNCSTCQIEDPLPMGCPYEESFLPSGIPNPSLLVLSGGASHGAWGAGVIAGWPVSAPTPRPQFTVVTGISVGALQATFAFLGPQYNDKLRILFSEITTEQVYTTKWNFLWSNSLQSREPLKELIDLNLTRDVILEVAAQASRELWVGTVNLDTSQFCPWNLSTVAKNAQAAPDNSDEEKCYVELYRKIVWAASGAPVITPPVLIDYYACKNSPEKSEAPYVDGGARLRVFAREVLSPLIQNATTPTAYVIMNGKMVTHPRCVADQIVDITARAFEIMDHESLFGSLYAMKDKLAGNWKLQLSRIPDDYCLDFPNSEFVPDKLKVLFAKGRDSWLGPDTWTDQIPDSSAAKWPADCCSQILKCPVTQDCPLPWCSF